MDERVTDKKAIQEERTRRFIIEAAMALISSEGLAALNVRKIADRAAFSVGTLYNYFADLDAILAHAAYHYFDAVYEKVQQDTQGIADISTRIRRGTRSYAEYFLNNPEVFKLIFMAPLETIPENIAEQLMVPKVALLFHGWFIEAAEAGMLQQSRAELIEDALGNAVHGALLFHITGRSQGTAEALLERLDAMVVLELGGG